MDNQQLFMEYPPRYPHDVWFKWEYLRSFAVALTILTGLWLLQRLVALFTRSLLLHRISRTTDAHITTTTTGAAVGANVGTQQGGWLVSATGIDWLYRLEHAQQICKATLVQALYLAFLLVAAKRALYPSALIAWILVGVTAVQVISYLIVGPWMVDKRHQRGYEWFGPGLFGKRSTNPWSAHWIDFGVELVKSIGVAVIAIVILNDMHRDIGDTG